jgi:hypothetical protein
MTDLDTLRQALKSTMPGGQGSPGGTGGARFPAGPPLDLDRIMAKGRWARRRRRLAAGGGSVCLALAVTAGIAGIGRFGHHAAGPPLPAGPAASSQSTRFSNLPPSPVPTPSPSRTPRAAVSGSRPEGKVIDTGISDAQGELVLWVVKVRDNAIPQTHFGIMAGTRTRAGKLIPGVMTNESNGSGTAPGFHALESPIAAGQPEVSFPEFGYYAGPAAAITGRAHGTGLLHAAIAHWSRDHTIVLFWFPPQANPGGRRLTSLTATDARGNLLPPGHNTPGIG